MRLLTQILALALVAFSAGCMSPETRQKLMEDCDGRMLYLAVPIEPYTGQAEAISLEQDLSFRADTTAWDKNIPYIIGKGRYELKFVGAEGRFYTGTDRNIRFGGAFGIRSFDGGIFIPHDSQRKYMLWIPDTGGSIGVATGNGILMVGSGPNPNNIRWVIAVPREVQAKLERALQTRPNKSL